MQKELLQLPSHEEFGPDLPPETQEVYEELSEDASQADLDTLEEMRQEDLRARSEAVEAIVGQSPFTDANGVLKVGNEVTDGNSNEYGGGGNGARS